MSSISISNHDLLTAFTVISKTDTALTIIIEDQAIWDFREIYEVHNNNLKTDTRVSIFDERTGLSIEFIPIGHKKIVGPITAEWLVPIISEDSEFSIYEIWIRDCMTTN